VPFRSLISGRIREKQTAKGTEEQTTAGGTEGDAFPLFLWLLSVPLYPSQFAGLSDDTDLEEARHSSPRSALIPNPEKDLVFTQSNRGTEMTLFSVALFLCVPILLPELA
jgi:hypothetical protein